MVVLVRFFYSQGRQAKCCSLSLSLCSCGEWSLWDTLKAKLNELRSVFSGN